MGSIRRKRLFLGVGGFCLFVEVVWSVGLKSDVVWFRAGGRFVFE